MNSTRYNMTFGKWDKPVKNEDGSNLRISTEASEINPLNAI